jgi:hypothetical protein
MGVSDPCKSDNDLSRRDDQGIFDPRRLNVDCRRGVTTTTKSTRATMIKEKVRYLNESKYSDSIVALRWLSYFLKPKISEMYRLYWQQKAQGPVRKKPAVLPAGTT